jgi:hypothetical protein
VIDVGEQEREAARGGERRQGGGERGRVRTAREADQPALTIGRGLPVEGERQLAMEKSGGGVDRIVVPVGGIEPPT